MVEKIKTMKMNSISYHKWTLWNFDYRHFFCDIKAKQELMLEGTRGKPPSNPTKVIGNLFYSTDTGHVVNIKVCLTIWEMSHTPLYNGKDQHHT